MAVRDGLHGRRQSHRGRGFVLLDLVLALAMFVVGGLAVLTQLDFGARRIIDAEHRMGAVGVARTAIGLLETGAMRQSESGVVVERSVRTFALASARPSEVASAARRVAEAMLRPSDGSTYEAPGFEPVDELRQLIVRASENQFATIEAIVEQLDTPSGGTRFVVIPVRNTTPGELLNRVRTAYEPEAARRKDPALQDLVLTPDPAAGAIVVRGSGVAVALFQEILGQIQQLVPPARTTRMIELQNANVQQVLPVLNKLIASREPVDPAREVPAPELSVLERTNTLVVKGEPAQHAMVAELVQRLDTLEPRDLLPMKLLQLRTANAANIAKMLTEQYDRRPQADRMVGEKAKVDQAVEYAETLAATPGIEGREINVIPLRHANAQRAQTTLRQFFEQRARAEGRGSSEVTVIGSADGNILITTAGEDDMDFAFTPTASSDTQSFGSTQIRLGPLF